MEEYWVLIMVIKTTRLRKTHKMKRAKLTMEQIIAVDGKNIVSNSLYQFSVAKGNIFFANLCHIQRGTKKQVCMEKTSNVVFVGNVQSVNVLDWMTTVNVD